MAFMWSALAIGLSLYWPKYGLVIREVVGGLGWLATMTFVVRPLFIGAPGRRSGLRYVGAGAVLAPMVIVWLVMLGICGHPKSRISARRAVASGLASTALLLAGSLLPKALFGLFGWMLILGGQLVSWREPRDAGGAAP